MKQIAYRRRQAEHRQLLEQLTIAALSGITGHVTGPKERNGETMIEAHARWATQVAEAAHKRLTN